MRRLAIVATHPIQYFAPLYAKLAQRADIKVKVFFFDDKGVKEYHDPGFGRTLSWDIPLLQGYEHEFASSCRAKPTTGLSGLNRSSVVDMLERYSPDTVWIHGYGSRVMLRAWLWASGKVRIIFSGDSELLHRRTVVVNAAKNVLLPMFFSRIDAFLTIGDNNEDYYRNYGVPDSKFYRGAIPIDADRFTKVYLSMTRERRLAVRARYGLDPDSTVVLLPVKFTPIKRPMDLIEAFARCRGITKSRVQALLIGSGSLEGALKARVAELKLVENVRFAGFVNQREMPEVLSAGDIVALCSEKEPYGISITEGMACGCAVIASDRVGCVGPTSPARPGFNALVYPVGDTERLAECIARLADDTPLLAGMSRASLELSRTQDTSAVAEAILKAMAA